MLEKVHQIFPNVKLTLVGALNSDQRHIDYTNSLKSRVDSQSLPVEFKLNVSRTELEEVLSDSQIYLHACGFGGDLIGMPERQEHFGIAVVEGMMVGLIPIVFDGGGPAEIIRASGVGFTYRNIEEAVDAVMMVAAMSPQERGLIGEKAKKFAKRFTDETFQSRVRDILNMVQKGKEG